MKNSIKCILVTVVLLSFLFGGCSKEPLDPSAEKEEMVLFQGVEVSQNSFEPNQLRILVTEDYAKDIEAITDENGFILSSATRALGYSLRMMRVKKIKRTFPYAGEFEARTRAEGLHLWYDVELDSSLVMTRSRSDFSSLDGVKEVELRPKTIRNYNNIVTDFMSSSIAKTLYMVTTRASADFEWPFDDPELPKQWHYYNDGSANASISGADINVFPAWKYYTTGRPDVIVSVVDGGIDFEHEDLIGNMWHNPDKTGNQKYGYNFVNNGYTITPENHGTHVAGTIAAVNNNGKGVSGIAGGDAKKGLPGVKLMSCQIFQDGDSGGRGATAIKWGADHGAVISQNSWGYPKGVTTPSSDKAAIDYFNQYAGLDKDGNQVGPMRGGVVIFAAGNENNNIGFPAEYEGAIAVSSISSNYIKTYYSNYGDWVDVAAPGGESSKGVWVRSTVVGGYGNMQGTSMACPHVSGVAALIISVHGGPGFTNDALRSRLTQFVTPIAQYNKNKPMGSGLVNAYLAIVGDAGEAPEQVTGLKVESESNRILFQVTIPRDPDEENPSGITIYYSKTPFETIYEAMAKSYPIGNLKAGDVMSGAVEGLEFETLYYVRADAYDMASNKSVLSESHSVTTGVNHAPTIQSEGETSVTLRKFEKKTLFFNIFDVDKHKMEISLSNNPEGVTITKLSDNRVQVMIDATAITPGNYTTSIVVSDEYSKSSQMDISYQILANTPPKKVKDIEDITFKSTTSPLVKLKASDYFLDEDGEILTYKVELENDKVVNINYSEGYFYITPLSIGITDVTITGSDIEDKSVTNQFQIQVGEINEIFNIVPNPVVDVMTINALKELNVSVRVYNTWGAEVFFQQVTISRRNPIKVDMSKLPGGVYLVMIKYEDKEFKQNVVKL